jgi:hypothetical protein
MKTFNSFLLFAVAIIGLVEADKVKGARGRLNAESARLQDRILTGSNGGIKRRTKKGASASCNDSCSDVASKLNEKYTKLLKDIEELNEEVTKFNNCASEDDEINYSCELQEKTCDELAESSVAEEEEESVDVFACFGGGVSCAAPERKK